VQTPEGHTNGVKAVAFSHDGSLIASASDDGTVRLWNPSTGREVRTLKGHTGLANAVAFSDDGSLLASTSWDRTVRLWNPSTGQEVQKFENVLATETIRFTIDNKTLLTNRGAISIDSASMTRGFTHTTIIIKKDWVQRGDRNLLRLPLEYRSICSVYGNKLAFGLNSGQVSFIQLDQS
jgi:WD40 repeat protein